MKHWADEGTPQTDGTEPKAGRCSRAFSQQVSMNVSRLGLPRWWGLLGLFSGILSLAGSGLAQPTVHIGLNFTASTWGVDSDALPPDANGAIGPAHFVEFINGRYSVFDKTTGLRQQTSTDLDFWINAGVPLPGNLSTSDPRIVYDPPSQRWFATQVDEDPNVQLTNRFLFAVSSTSDPTRSWTAFAFRVNPQSNGFGDFPTLGIDTNGVYLGAEEFDEVGNDVGPVLVMIPKADVLANPPTVDNRIFFGVLPNGGVAQSAVTRGSASTGEPVLAIGDLGGPQDTGTHSTLAAYSIGANSTSDSPVLAASKVLTVPSYTVPLDPTQPNGLNNLDDGDARISATVYRVNDLLYAVHSTEVNNRAAIQWFKLNAVDLTLIQSGTLTDPNLDLFYPSIAANSEGIVVIAFNASSTTTYVSSYARVGQTTNNQVTFGPMILLKSGAASFLTSDSSGTSRWGDYGATSIDPLNANHFWTIQTIPSRRNAWSTQVTELIVSTSASDVTLEVTRLGNEAILSWTTNAPNLQLQFTPTLSVTNNWTTLTNTPAVVSNVFQTAIPIQGSQGYFRLFGQ
jgi:hypothetical protein